MNAWVITCLMLAVLFGIMGVILALLKEKGAMLISGFNTLAREEREKYDKKKMSIDARNNFLLWSVILLFGAGLSYFFSNYFAVFAMLIWIILFFKGVHIDTDKAFDKYKKA
ncbi:hypothetical protein OXPF_27310 [Oxobacter pfennigii]|uniref:DUF3784 domain-containing protein n=1 Tax=Oxobacter pfennigii TaxID=36849 RepID=A0A0P8WLI9_9CLOT|nr:DUF3784 domain-containing protein [Oxobacter pfennigii]KPU43290.1 hypothetical protein OXPF_27310 [Oxobacter pfennigii]